MDGELLKKQKKIEQMINKIALYRQLNEENNSQHSDESKNESKMMQRVETMKS